MRYKKSWQFLCWRTLFWHFPVCRCSFFFFLRCGLFGFFHTGETLANFTYAFFIPNHVADLLLMNLFQNWICTYLHTFWAKQGQCTQKRKWNNRIQVGLIIFSLSVIFCRSTEDVFDPRPAQSSPVCHCLTDLLCHISPAFKQTFTTLKNR